ncbi:MAG: hypothetical protein AAGB31_11095 [Bdellovibrio sp.]
MKRWQSILVIFAFCVGCTDSHKEDQASPNVQPVGPAKLEPSVRDQKYHTENTENILKIYLGTNLAAEIKGGKIISESSRFVAYNNGGSIELMGKDGSKIYSCDSNCLVKVTNSFASVQTGAGDGVIFDANSEIMFTSSTDEKTLYRISETFASVSSRSSAMLFRVGSRSSIYTCSDVACDILVSNSFAAVVEQKLGTGSIIGSSGTPIYSFSVPGPVQISNNFAAVTHEYSAVIYHSKKGSIFSASVPVRIELSDTTAVVSQGGVSSFKFNQNGNSF